MSVASMSALLVGFQKGLAIGSIRSRGGEREHGDQSQRGFPFQVGTSLSIALLQPQLAPLLEDFTGLEDAR